MAAALRIWSALLLAVTASGCAADRIVQGVADERERVSPLQAAIDALPASGGTVRVPPGVYRGRLYVTRPGVRLIGTGTRPEDVVIVGTQSSATTGSLYASATAYVAADDFYARNLTFANDWEADPERGSTQALALAVSGDRALFERVRVLGGQDTLYLTQPPGKLSRQLFRDCYIEGHVDFIFGNAASYFDGCRIHGVKHDTVIYTAHSRNAKDEGGAFVFHDSVFTADAAPAGVYLGRPWRPHARVLLIDSRIATKLAPTGWREWKPGMTQDGGTVAYAEYRTRYDQGAPARSRITVLTPAQAANWSLEAFFKGDIRWTRPPDAD